MLVVYLRVEEECTVKRGQNEEEGALPKGEGGGRGARRRVALRLTQSERF